MKLPEINERWTYGTNLVFVTAIIKWSKGPMFVEVQSTTGGSKAQFSMEFFLANYKRASQ